MSTKRIFTPLEIAHPQTLRARKAPLGAKPLTGQARVRFQMGFTALELLISIAILVLLLAVVVPPFLTFRKATILSTETQGALSFINKARLSSMSSKNDLRYGVHFTTNTITIFQTPTYVVDTASNEVKTLDPSLYFSYTSIGGGGSDLFFQKITGATNQYATTTLSFVGSTATSSIILVRPSGVVTTY